jgi:hypothetical protein
VVPVRVFFARKKAAITKGRKRRLLRAKTLEVQIILLIFLLLHPSQILFKDYRNIPIIIMSLTDIVPPGVVTGDNLLKLLEHARDNAYAIPAVNCTR